MALMTGKEYVESIRKMNMQVYMFGEKVENPVDHPILRPSLNSVRMTYDLAQMPEYENLMTATSQFTGGKARRQRPVSRDVWAWMLLMPYTVPPMSVTSPMAPNTMKIL